jgi:hypothetical protein
VSAKELSWHYPQGSIYAELIQFGDYQSCGESARSGKVHKWFSEPQGKFDCRPNVDKITDANRLDKTASAWATEHVFEAQTVKQFWTWLATGTDSIPGYTRPSYDWATAVVVGMAPLASGLQVFTWQDQTFFHNTVQYSLQGAIQMGFGSVENPEDLALTSQAINGGKMLWMGLAKPSYLGGSARATRKTIRDNALTFQDLQWNAGTTDPIWNKFMRVSNWIDAVMWNFDKNYPWGADAGEPTNSRGTPSMRSLWAYFLEATLGTIEANAQAWGAEAGNHYKTSYGPFNTQAEVNWFNAAFGSGGWATATNGGLRFPRVPGGYGIYGVTANTAFMTDGAGQAISIGLPTAIR